MVSGIDPNKVILTGENPYIRLADEPDGVLSTRTSLWKVILSPLGPGNALFIVSELTGNQPRVYSDNIAMARWFQRNIMGYHYKPFADENLNVIEAAFEKYGDIRSFWSEAVVSSDDEIILTWYDICEPHMINPAPNSRPDRPHGVYACMIPSAGARLTLNGVAATGKTYLHSEYPETESVSSLAFSETWLVEM